MTDYERKPIDVRATEALGQGFDLASDFKLDYVKKCPIGTRLVVIDETKRRDVMIPGVGTIKDVPERIRIDKGDHTRFSSDILQFNQMSELINQRSSVQGKVPSGYLNAVFDLSGLWLKDAEEAKYLAFDGSFVSLYYLHLTASPMVLSDHVKKSVPRLWDPASLSRFIKTYGTHILTGMAIGGHHLICTKQRSSSPIPPGELKGYLEQVGDRLFSDAANPFDRRANYNDKRLPDLPSDVLQPQRLLNSKTGLTVFCSKRGGDIFAQSHSSWLQTVPSNPEAILFKFVPITSLLNGIPGSGYLSHAINLYLRYKPSLEDLPYFLEFQVPLQWSPLYCELPLRHQRRKAAVPSLQFHLLAPKISVSLSQVSSDEKPVTGLRLFLEGTRSNRLAIHVQHLSNLPHIMTSPKSTIQPRWRGSDDYESHNQFLEPVRWKRYSNICSSVVQHDPQWLQEPSASTGVFIVTGAQLVVQGRWPTKVLHLHLCFTHIPNCSIRKTEWASAPEATGKSSFFTNLSTTFTFSQRGAPATGDNKKDPKTLNSGVFPDGPPVPVRSTKLLKYIDATEITRGPYDAPGHWLVTAAKLVTDGGRISLQVKFALLDYSQE